MDEHKQPALRNLQRRRQWFDRGQCGLCQKKGRVDKFCEWCGLAWCDKCTPEKCRNVSSYDDLWQTVLKHVKEVAEEGWDDDDDGTVRKPTALEVEQANLVVSWCKEGQGDKFGVPVVSIDPCDCVIRLWWGTDDPKKSFWDLDTLKYDCHVDKKEEDKQALLKKVQETLNYLSKNH